MLDQSVADLSLTPPVAIAAHYWPMRPTDTYSTATRVLFMDLIRVILSVIIPPLGVFLQVGIGLQFWINIVLTLLGYIPGVVHAVWIIARR